MILTSPDIEKQNDDRIVRDYRDREMFCFKGRFIGSLIVLCFLIIRSNPVLSCAGTRVPRQSQFEDDSVYDDSVQSGSDTTKDDTKLLPRRFWIGCKTWDFFNICYGHLASLKPIYIVYGCVTGVLSVLIAEVIDYYLLSGDRNGRIPVLCQIASILYWLFCVTFAPFFYWPELVGPIYQEVMITRERSPTSAHSMSPTPPRTQEISPTLTHTTPPTPPRRQKDKYVQTSGPSNRRYLKQAKEYEMTVTGCRHERIAKLKKTARMLQQFRTKWKGYIDELHCKNKLIDEALAETICLERQVVFLHEACALLREQLKTQQTVNKGVLQRYHDMHKQVLGYLGHTDLKQSNLQYRGLDSSGV